MMRPARQAKSCSRKVNEILTAGVGWIAWSDCDQPGLFEARQDRGGGCGHKLAHRPPARSARRTHSSSLKYAVTAPDPKLFDQVRKHGLTGLLGFGECPKG